MSRTQTLGLLIALLATSAAPGADDVAAPTPVGWRGDRTGAFPDVEPVTEFSESLNVLWKTPMPDWSNGSPVAAAGRVFVCSEPDVLICLDAADGSVLWQKQTSHLDLLPPEEAAAARRMWEEEEAFERQRNALRYESMALKKAADAAPDDAQAKQRREEHRRRLEEMGFEDLERDYRGGYRGDTEQGKAQAKRRKELDEKYGLYFETWDRWDYWIGHSMPTPVCDGQHVWVAFGSNTVACYDLEGNRRWMKWFPRGPEKQSKAAGDPYWGGYPRALFVASPLLIADRLVVQAGRAIRALDANTGELLWEQDIDRYFEYAVGSPVHVNAAGVDLVVTAFGDVRRLSDGKLMATNVGYSPNGASPTSRGDVVYFENGANPGGQVPNVRNTIEAVRLSLPSPDAEQVSAETLWSHKSRGGYVSPVCHDNILYHVDGGFLTARDAGTGEVLNEPVVVRHEYSGLTLAGDYLFVSDNKGNFTVWTAGPQTKLVAENVLEVDEPVGEKLEQRKQASGDLHWQFTFGLPFFDAAGRMYVRSYDNLYCIGRP